MADTSVADVLFKKVNGTVLKAIMSDLINYCNNTFSKSADLNSKADKVNIVAGLVGSKSATSGYEFQVPWFEVNSEGLVTNYGTHTHTIDELFTRNSDGSITPKKQ